MFNKVECFFKVQKETPDRSDLFIAESHDLSTVQVRYCKSAYGGSLTEVDGKGLVSLNR